MVRFARWEYDHVPEVAKEWFKHGFLVEADAAFSCWLEAARAGDEGDMVNALHCAYQARAIDPPDHDYRLSYAKLVGRKAVDWPASIRPEEFSELCLRLQSLPGYRVLRVYDALGDQASIDKGLRETLRSIRSRRGGDREPRCLSTSCSSDNEREFVGR